MANPSDRLPTNAEGRFYVDANCIDCDQCREAAPTLFGRDDGDGRSFVLRQPETPHDFDLITEVISLCPCQAIGETAI